MLRELKNPWLAGTLFFMIVLIVFLYSIPLARAEDHSGHRPQDMELHQKFYKTWMMPDNRSISCCHDQDCKPALTKQIDGQWFAKHEDDPGDYTPIPPRKIETERDSPDGRSHLCGTRYTWSTNQFGVYCFILGNGG